MSENRVTTKGKLRLKSIKLAGFKSFVDPTTVPFPSNLVAVVGPNGCGKSNIIDAVRWVMGESSARQLRGDSMSDVIFNGSSGRKPVGQASIELVFDNPDGAIGGEYAAFSEIALRRTVTREGQSTYYINGHKSRRRDIIGIFLGTGLGPRSYAIIGQGTISRLIEAKPDELRVYLEEAAGISKYKERRRETENRMRHTRDNLDRLNDLREELDKQLNRLQRQAAAANRYQNLKQEERKLKAELVVLRHRILKQQLNTLTEAIRENELQLEQANTEQRRIDKEIELLRDRHTDASDAQNDIQEQYYTIGAQVSRIEQSILHQRERRQQLQEDIDTSQQALIQAQQHLVEDEQRVAILQAEIDEIVPQVDVASEQAQQATTLLHDTEQLMQQLQQQWDDFNQQSAQSSQQAQVQQTRIQHLEQVIQQARQRIARFEEDLQRLDCDEIAEEIEQLVESIAQVEQQQLCADEALTQHVEAINYHRDTITSFGKDLDRYRSDLQRLKGRQGSLETLQQAALGKDNQAICGWMERHELADKPRLAQGLTVAAGWEKAVETVLGKHLQAVCVDDLQSVLGVISGFTEGELSVVTTDGASTIVNQDQQTLASKVTSQYILDDLLAGILVADTLAEAVASLSTLGPNSSVITQEGIWLGKNWLRIAKECDTEAGVLQREAQLRDITDTIAQTVIAVDEAEARLNDSHAQLQDLELTRDEKQKMVTEITRQLSDLQAQKRVKAARLEQMQQRIVHIQQDVVEQEQSIDDSQQALNQARTLWQQAMAEMETQADLRHTLSSKRENQRQQLDEVRLQARDKSDSAHQLQVSLQGFTSECDAKQQNLQRMQHQIDTMTQRLSSLTAALADSEQPLQDQEAQLETVLQQRVVVEEQLQQARAKVGEYEYQTRELEEQRHQTEEKIITIRNNLEQKRLQSQGAEVRQNTLLEQLTELALTIEAIEAQMPEEAEEKAWEAALQQVAGKITRLGAINLAAIDEYKTEAERKTYLDQQHADLMEALETLENAIRKIDKETKTRFKDTFDTVNSSLQKLFPKIFGGGESYLQLTGDDLLDTGVSVMARPPGKRISSIQLLSGGEKALSAIALVFAIFQLNPAPFCMLDEVDAPLDDSNVIRYCNIVKEMSKEVQFIFISHNKIAIEMGEHLAGVTMREPGVSRMVSVDIDEALSLAQA